MDGFSELDEFQCVGCANLHTLYHYRGIDHINRLALQRCPKDSLYVGPTTALTKASSERSKGQQNPTLIRHLPSATKGSSETSKGQQHPTFTYYLSNLSSLRELVVNECQLENEELRQIVTSLEKSATSIEVLEFQNQNITTFPLVNFFVNMRMLSLARNKITQLNKGALNIESLNDLDLRNNLISFIEHEAFAGIYIYKIIVSANQSAIRYLIFFHHKQVTLPMLVSH